MARLFWLCAIEHTFYAKKNEMLVITLIITTCSSMIIPGNNKMLMRTYFSISKELICKYIS